MTTSSPFLLSIALTALATCCLISKLIRSYGSCRHVRDAWPLEKIAFCAHLRRLFVCRFAPNRCRASPGPALAGLRLRELAAWTDSLFLSLLFYADLRFRLSENLLMLLYHAARGMVGLTPHRAKTARV